MGQQPSTAGKGRKKNKAGDVGTSRVVPSEGSEAKADDIRTSPHMRIRRVQQPADGTSPRPTRTHPTPTEPTSSRPATTDTLKPHTLRSQADPNNTNNPFEAPLDHIRDEERPYQQLAKTTHFDVPTLRKLHQIFEEIAESKDDDGIIDAAELTHAMGLDNQSLLARAIFKRFDLTESMQINFLTWVTTLSALSSKASIEEKIKFSFSLYDLNGDGQIDVGELRSLLEAAVRESVLGLTDEQVKAVCENTLANVDKDKNGLVDYSEYRQVVMKSKKFLESFSLDITHIVGSFRTNSRSKANRSSEGISEEEVVRKQLKFQSRQSKTYADSSEERKDSGTESNEELKPSENTTPTAPTTATTTKTTTPITHLPAHESKQENEKKEKLKRVEEEGKVEKG